MGGHVSEHSDTVVLLEIQCVLPRVYEWLAFDIHALLLDIFQVNVQVFWCPNAVHFDHMADSDVMT